MTAQSARGAMLLLFDVAPEAADEHDDWHTHEHMPERLAIPGFVRGTRWKRRESGPQYCVLYEVTELAVLDSPAYRARLDHPSPWTAKMMARYAGMRRTLCDVVAGEGEGIGGACLVMTFAAAAGRGDDLRRRLVTDVLPPLAPRRGLAAWRLLYKGLTAAMTREQAIRGSDQSVNGALWVTGYDSVAVEALAAGDLAADRLSDYGAERIEHAVFALAHALAAVHTGRSPSDPLAGTGRA